MSYGCPGKYNSVEDSIEDLSCKKAEVGRIWEDNQNILVQDQR